MKKINRRKHHREKVQERAEAREQESQERGQVREERGQAREGRGERGQERYRDGSAQRNGKTEDEKIDRREFDFTDLNWLIEGPTILLLTQYS